MKLFGVLCIMLFVSQQAECGKKDFQHLQTKMDYFLVSVIEVRQSLRDLRDDVASLQEQQNATISVDQAETGEAEFTQSGSGSLACSNCKIEPKMSVLEEGFQEEKALLRQELQQQNTNIITIETIVTDIKATLDETLKEQDQTIDNVAIRVNDMKVELHGKHETSMNKAMHDISETMNVIVAVNETLNVKYKDAVNKCDTLSRKVDNVETNIKHVQETLSDLEHSLSTLKHNQETIKQQMKIGKPVLGFKLYASSWYKIHREKRTWSEAQRQCEDEDMHLAEINDKDELKQVDQWIGINYYWLGATDSEREGTWQWSTSGQSVLSSLWAYGQPDNYRGNEHCMHSYGTLGSINDRPCDSKLMFVCELEMYTQDK